MAQRCMRLRLVDKNWTGSDTDHLIFHPLKSRHLVTPQRRKEIRCCDIVLLWILWSGWWDGDVGPRPAVVSGQTGGLSLTRGRGSRPRPDSELVALLMGRQQGSRISNSTGITFSFVWFPLLLCPRERKRTWAGRRAARAIHYTTCAIIIKPCIWIKGMWFTWFHQTATICCSGGKQLSKQARLATPSARATAIAHGEVETREEAEQPVGRVFYRFNQ